jgi:protoporphyrinogen/coproporphyrinogen III oxidase
MSGVNGQVDESGPARRHVVVIGGGIAGLASALRLAPHVRVTLLENADRLGGKISTAADGVETGAENFLLRDPAGGPSTMLRLVAELGLAGDLVHPEPARAALYVDRELRPLPAGTLLGIPGPDAVLDGLATVSGADVDLGRPVLAPGADAAVGELVRARLGDQVVDRLIDPLLGGVYAGRADELSVAATIPMLHRQLGSEHTLRAAVAAAMAASRAHRVVAEPAGAIEPAAPVDGVPALPPQAIFGTVRGGLSRLIEAARDRLERLGGTVLTGLPARQVRRSGEGFEIAYAGGWLAADGVVVAVPAGKAARLVAEVDEQAAGEIGVLDYASVGLVTLVLPAGAELPDLSGFLVPEEAGLRIKAATFFSRKWAHLRRPDGAAVLRGSLGRAGAPEVLQRPDAELIDITLRDIATVLGRPLPTPVLARVRRWGGGLPQYGPGHVDRVARARRLLSQATGGPVALAGAGFDGVGLPACVRSGQQAADLVLTRLAVDDADLAG